MFTGEEPNNFMCNFVERLHATRIICGRADVRDIFMPFCVVCRLEIQFVAQIERLHLAGPSAQRQQHKKRAPTGDMATYVIACMAVRCGIIAGFYWHFHSFCIFSFQGFLVHFAIFKHFAILAGESVKQSIYLLCI